MFYISSCNPYECNAKLWSADEHSQVWVPGAWTLLPILIATRVANSFGSPDFVHIGCRILMIWSSYRIKLPFDMTLTSARCHDCFDLHITLSWHVVENSPVKLSNRKIVSVIHMNVASFTVLSTTWSRLPKAGHYQQPVWVLVLPGMPWSARTSCRL